MWKQAHLPPQRGGRAEGQAACFWRTVCAAGLTLSLVWARGTSAEEPDLNDRAQQLIAAGQKQDQYIYAVLNRRSPQIRREEILDWWLQKQLKLDRTGQLRMVLDGIERDIRAARATRGETCYQCKDDKNAPILLNDLGLCPYCQPTGAR